MSEVVSVDKAGRLVIPKSIRDSLGVKNKTKFIILEGDQGQIFLQKIDLEKMATKMEKDLKGRNIDAIVKKVRKDTNAKIRQKYRKIFA